MEVGRVECFRFVGSGDGRIDPSEGSIAPLTRTFLLHFIGRLMKNWFTSAWTSLELL